MIYNLKLAAGYYRPESSQTPSSTVHFWYLQCFQEVTSMLNFTNYGLPSTIICQWNSVNRHYAAWMKFRLYERKPWKWFYFQETYEKPYDENSVEESYEETFNENCVKKRKKSALTSKKLRWFPDNTPKIRSIFLNRRGEPWWTSKVRHLRMIAVVLWLKNPDCYDDYRNSDKYESIMCEHWK